MEVYTANDMIGTDIISALETDLPPREYIRRINVAADTLRHIDQNKVTRKGLDEIRSLCMSGYTLDLQSTILSRKNSGHAHVGPYLFVRPKNQEKK